MDYVVKKSITIKALPAQVWDALTNPEKTKEYFFKCKVASDWKEGSKITFKGKMFWIVPIKLTGKILAIEPEKLLQYSLRNASDKQGKTSSTVTDKLTYQNGETTLSITDDVGEGDDAEKRYKRSKKGWDKILKGLKKLVEKSE
ncbi:SRPBCC domain-containing protein [Mucilaginibacter sp.]|uniref:SRPBCC domain-containing protein n=1 Tax=Mucilaginibacter sp. TaxID=1882438 RepID=UPI003264DE93